LAKGAGIGAKKMTKSHYNKEFKHLAQSLRTHSTKGEIILWNQVLKNKKMYGFQFLRQFAIDNYIVDFICRKAKIIIEVDGYSHNFKFEADTQRDGHLAKLGYKVIRFTEKEIKNDLANVIKNIEHNVLNIDNSINPPAPFAKGEMDLT
jgi:very-short-patch-repair endonuclease